MTLSTDVYVLDQIDPVEVFEFCQDLLVRFDDQGRTRAEQVVSRGDSWRGNGAKRIGNQIGQGLPAILDVLYRGDAPLTTVEQAAAHDEDCDKDCSGRWHQPACWLNVDFDTSYSYRGPGGVGCGALHAVLVGLLGQWLDSRGIRWSWRNEFTGEIHNDAASLVELVTGGAEAEQWFRGAVVPAIERMAAEAGAQVKW